MLGQGPGETQLQHCRLFQCFSPVELVLVSLSTKAKVCAAFWDTLGGVLNAQLQKTGAN